MLFFHLVKALLMPVVGEKGMKRTALALALTSALFLSLVVGVLVVKEAKANPFIIFKPATPIPGTIPPIITMSSPKNNTAYASNTGSLSFNITKPQPPIALEAGVTSVKYTLDGNLTGLYYCTHYSSNSPPGLPEFKYSTNLTLPEGNHTLVLSAVGVVLPGNMTLFSVGSSYTVFFTVGANSETSIPEFPSWIFLPLFVMATLSVIIYRKRLPKKMAR